MVFDKLTFCDIDNLWRHVHIIHRQSYFFAHGVLAITSRDGDCVDAMVFKSSFPDTVITNRLGNGDDDFVPIKITDYGLECYLLTLIDFYRIFESGNFWRDIDISYRELRLDNSFCFTVSSRNGNIIGSCTFMVSLPLTIAVQRF